MAKGAMDEAAMRKAIVAIMLDTTLSEPEKALKRQALMAGKWAPPAAAPAAGERERERAGEGGEGGGGGTRPRGGGPSPNLSVRGTADGRRGAALPPPPAPSAPQARTSPTCSSSWRRSEGELEPARAAGVDARASFFRFGFGPTIGPPRRPRITTLTLSPSLLLHLPLSSAPDAKGKAKAGSAAAAAPAPAAAAAPGATMFDETLKCAVCMELCERPVTVRE